MRGLSRASGACTLVALLAVAPAAAVTCTVPGTHATIQAAVDEASCTTIQLAAQTYTESLTIQRALILSGPGGGGAILAGRLRVASAGTVVAVSDLAVQNSCTSGAVSALGGARLSGSGLRVTRGNAFPCPPDANGLFSDGFETGDVSRWAP